MLCGGEGAVVKPRDDEPIVPLEYESPGVSSEQRGRRLAKAVAVARIGLRLAYYAVVVLLLVLIVRFALRYKALLDWASSGK